MTLDEFRDKLLAVASKDTCYPPLARFYPGHSLFGHCACVARAFQDAFGGEIMTAKGVPQEGIVVPHYWNRLSTATEIDLIFGDPRKYYQAPIIGLPYKGKLAGKRIQLFCSRLSEATSGP